MSSTAEIVQITTVAEQIAAVVGAEHCTTDLKERTFYSTDLSFLPGEVAEVVVRPGNTDELAAAVGIAARAGMAVVARGGGSPTPAAISRSGRIRCWSTCDA